MGRGLDGFRYLFVGRLCSFEGPPAKASRPSPVRRRARPATAIARHGARSRNISVAIAWGKHLFPFRTEKLSPTAPMVLVPYGTGRVGRRRFLELRLDPAIIVDPGSDEPRCRGSSSLSTVARIP